MRNVREMPDVQIEITNACIYQCSNCTRFCGHHQTPYFMEFDDVKKAINSLDGFQGNIGIMGGEPTLHPQFVEISKYVGEKFKDRKRINVQMLHPHNRFAQAIIDLKLMYVDPVKREGGVIHRSSVPGLWSVMGDKYIEHFELIQDVYKKQILNDHQNEIYHDPLLISRKELCVPDDEWETIRDNCWLQNSWSASITPKGGFFCEVAAALDMLFDGPGGMDIESGWWNKDISEFKEQFWACELCGAPFDTFTRNANDEIDDMSPILYEKLKEIGSKKIESGKYTIVEIDRNGVIAESSKASTIRFGGNLPYAESEQAKFNKDKTKLYPKAFEAIVFLKTTLTAEAIAQYQELFFDQFQTIYFVVETEAMKKAFVLPDAAKCICYSLESEADKKSLLTLTKHGIYVAVFSDGVLPKKSFVADLSGYVFNPGALLYTNATQNNDTLERFVTVDGKGEFMLFNRAASSLKALQGDFSKIFTIFDMQAIWNPEKIVPFDDDLFIQDTFVQVQKGLRYAMYGTGLKAEEDIVAIQNDGAEITGVFDSNTEKHGKVFHGLTIQSPEALIKNKDKFDIIVIASTEYYFEIRDFLCEKGFELRELLYYRHR